MRRNGHGENFDSQASDLEARAQWSESRRRGRKDGEAGAKCKHPNITSLPKNHFLVSKSRVASLKQLTCFFFGNKEDSRATSIFTELRMQDKNKNTVKRCY